MLTDEMPRLFAQHRLENVRDKDSDAVRTNFAAHLYSEPFARLARHPRMVEPIVQLFGEAVYMHQFKINARWPSTATSGSGIRTTVRGSATTRCPSRGR